MRLNLTEAQIRYLMDAIESAVVAGDEMADSIERELDLTLMDEESEEYDDGKVLIAGVLYDKETGMEADPQ